MGKYSRVFLLYLFRLLKRQKSYFPFLGRWISFVGTLWFFSNSLFAQESRISVASERAAEASKIKREEKPNMRIGPIDLRLGSGIGVEYNDNIGLSQKNRSEDFIFRPTMDIKAWWPVSELNTLRLDLGLGYAYYLNGGNTSQYALLSPDSGLSFDLYVSNFKINFHDHFAYSQDATQEITLAGTSSFGRFTNTAGVQVDWDINEVLSLSGGYDHFTLMSLEKKFDYLDQNAELFFTRASYILGPTTTTGVEFNTSQTEFDHAVLNNNQGYGFGPFVQKRFSPHLSGNISGGYQMNTFEQTGTTGDTRDQSAFYFNLKINHQLNEYLSQNLMAGRITQQGTTSNFVDTYYIKHLGAWRIFHFGEIATELFVEHGEESGGSQKEDILRYGGNLSFNYQLTEKTTVSLGYRYLERSSNIEDRSFYQNAITAQINYSF
jgi:hypothetical protein